MNRDLQRTVRERANGRFEYCAFPQEFAELPFEVDHVVARKHRGATNADNLALTCFYCNSYKGPNIVGIDPVTGATTGELPAATLQPWRGDRQRQSQHDQWRYCNGNLQYQVGDRHRP
jgi:hypothetical protein